MPSTGEGSGQQLLSDEILADDTESGVFMACVHSSGNVGIACYDASNAEVPSQQKAVLTTCRPAPPLVFRLLSVYLTQCLDELFYSCRGEDPSMPAIDFQ